MNFTDKYQFYEIPETCQIQWLDDNSVKLSFDIDRRYIR